MGKGKRRSDVQVVESLIQYLAKINGTVNQHELCSEMNITTKTAEKWLHLLQMIKHECPEFRYEISGDSPIIIRPYFTGSQEEILTQIHQYLASPPNSAG